MNNQIPAQESPNENYGDGLRDKFYERYRNVPAEGLARALLRDVLLAEDLSFDEYEWAMDYAENYLNARN